MNSPRHDTNNYWALRCKVQVLIDKRTVVIATPFTQNIATNPLPSNAVGPSGPLLNMILIKELPIESSQLIAPLGAMVQDCLVKTTSL